MLKDPSSNLILYSFVSRHDKEAQIWGNPSQSLSQRVYMERLEVLVMVLSLERLVNEFLAPTNLAQKRRVVVNLRCDCSFGVSY